MSLVTGWASRPCPHAAGLIGERVTAAGSNLAEEPIAKSPAGRERAKVLGVRTVVLGGPGTVSGRVLGVWACFRPGKFWTFLSWRLC